MAFSFCVAQPVFATDKSLNDNEEKSPLSTKALAQGVNQEPTSKLVSNAVIDSSPELTQDFLEYLAGLTEVKGKLVHPTQLSDVELIESQPTNLPAAKQSEKNLKDIQDTQKKEDN